MDSTRIKVISIVATTVVVGLLAFLTAGAAMHQRFSVVGATSIMLLFIAMLGCAYVFLHNSKTHQYVLTALIVLVSLIVGLFSLTTLIGSVLLFMFLSAGARLISTAAASGITFKLQPVLMPGLRMILAGAAIMVVVLALPVTRQFLQQGGAQVSPEVVAYLSRPVTLLLKNVVPEYSPDQTVNQIVDRQLEQQYKDLPSGLEVPPQQKDLIISDFSQKIGVPLTGDEKAQDVLAVFINNYVQKISTVDGILVTIILAGIGLLAVRALVPILSLITFGFATVIFSLAKRFGLVTMQKEQVPVDKLIL